MPVPWMRLLDTAIGLADIARTAAGGRGNDDPAPERPPEDLEVGSRAGGGLETRLASVVVAALKEAFDRDTRRLDLERQQLAAERERAERALRFELRRQAGEREIGRLRLLTGVAVATWIGTLVWSVRLIGGSVGSVGARVSLGAGWLFLLGAIAASFVAQSRAASAIEAVTLGDDLGRATPSGASGAAALWLMTLGLALVALAALIA